MRLVSALVLVSLLAGCASAPRPAAEPTVQQKLSIECVASNAEPSGCKTTHEIALVATFTRAEGAVPTVDDLRTEGTGETQF